MEVQKTIENALKSVENKELDFISLNSKELIRESIRLSLSLEETLNDIKAYVLETGFKNKKEEILFFKTLKPKISGKIAFYKKLVEIEGYSNNYPKQVKYYKKQIRKAGKRLKNNEIFKYYQTLQSDRDAIYFLRNNSISSNDNFFFEMDNNFTTYYDLRLSDIICNETIIEFCKKRIAFLTKRPIDIRLKWNGDKNSLVELIYALQYSNSITEDNIKKIARAFEYVFQIDLGDIYHAFYKVKCRTKGGTLFLDKLRDTLKNQIEQK